MKKALAIAVFAALSLPSVAADVLYKSVDANGTVMFSDMPPPQGSRILEERAVGQSSSPYSSGAPGTNAPASALEEAFAQLDYDAALAKANAAVDMAERALAQARGGGASRLEGLRLNVSTQAATANADHIEFCKRDLKIARQGLIDLLRSRQLASGRAPKSAQGG